MRTIGKRILAPYKYIFYLIFSFFHQYRAEYAVTNNNLNRAIGVIIILTFVMHETLIILVPSIFFVNLEVTFFGILSLNTILFVLSKKDLLTTYNVKNILIGRTILFIYIVLVQIIIINRKG